MWEYLRWLPMGIVVLGLICFSNMMWKHSKERDALWDEEEKRQQRVKNLYPEQSTYEERMGVQYGPKQDE